MHQVTVHEAKTNLSKLIQECLTGETVIIAKGKQPVVKLVPIRKSKRKRRIGGGSGVIIRMDDDFDAPLDDFEEYMK